MNADPTQLLRQLEPIVRPAYAAGPAIRPQAPLEHQSFDELLALAAQGGLESGRPVSVAFEPTDEITSRQLDRLSAAADVAEAGGARNALLLVDGRGLVLEVASRTLNAELSESSRFKSLDAAVYIPGDDQESKGSTLPPPTGIAPRGVAEQIQQARDTAA